MRVSTSTLLRAAQLDGYAVPAFNVVDAVSLLAVAKAAERAASPVIIQVSVRTARWFGVSMFAKMFEVAAERSRAPMSLHLDHCPDPEVIAEAVAAGWDSVLFDGSSLEFGAAVSKATEVVRLAHGHGVEVEWEVENIVGVEDGVGSDQLLHSYRAAKVVDAALAAGVDLLAPQLGTAHGRYRERPTLLPQRAREFRQLSELPLVLHGGTGLTASEFRSFVEAGISKINISTGLKSAYLESSLGFLREAERVDQWEPLPLFQAVDAAVGELANGYFDMFGSAGRVPTRETP